MERFDFKRVTRAGTILLWVLSIFVLVLTINAIKENRFIGGGVPESNTISVSGEGEVFAVPDTAQFSFSVNAQAETVEVAQADATERMNAILDYLEAEGVEEENIKTISYNVYPRYEFQRGVPTPQPEPAIDTPEGSGVSEASEPAVTYYPEGRQVLVGYEVTQTVRVKVEDTEQAGALLSGVGEREATNISGLSFTVDDEEALQRDARQLAIDDAKEKAEALADDLDVRLIRIVNFNESGNYPIPSYNRGAAFDAAVAEEAGAAPELPAGENRIVSNVTIVYEIR